MYFTYGEKELSYLRQRDVRLAAVIDQVGMIQREVDTDLFSSVVHHIIGQQISTKAQATIWQRMRDALGTVTAETILFADPAQLQSLGMTFRKADYIRDFAGKVHSGEFDLDAVCHMSDEDAIRALSSLRGVGVWTAEMILLFCMQRPDVSCLKNTAAGSALTAAWPACICGRHQAALSPACATTHRGRNGNNGSDTKPMKRSRYENSRRGLTAGQSSFIIKGQRKIFYAKEQLL